jgi:hypothetical protein
MGAVGQFIGVLLLIGFVGAYFWWIVALVAAVALIWGAQLAFREIRAEEVADPTWLNLVRIVGADLDERCSQVVG